MKMRFWAPLLAALAILCPAMALAAPDPVVRNSVGVCDPWSPTTCAGQGGLVVATGSVFAVPSSSFTRPNDTTAYAVGDLVANSTTAASVTPLSWTATRFDASTTKLPTATSWVFKATLSTTNTLLVGDTFVLHLYASSPTPANGDNGAWSTNAAGWICDITVTMNATAFTDVVAGQGVPNSSNACMVSLASGQTIYGLVSTGTVFTPTASSVWTVSLEIQEN